MENLREKLIEFRKTIKGPGVGFHTPFLSGRGRGRLSYSLPFREGLGVGFLREGSGVGFSDMQCHLFRSDVERVEGVFLQRLIGAGGCRGEARALSSSCVG